MILRTKIIIGTIIGVLWAILCVGLALIPTPTEINSTYIYNVSSNESYTLNITNTYAKITHLKINELGQSATVTNIYKGNLEHVDCGGTISFYETEKLEQACGLVVNAENINLIGQKNITAFKYVGDYVLLNVNDKYICLSENGFENYDTNVGLYGKTFKEFKNPCIDVYIKQNSANIKEILYDEIYSVKANGACNEKFFDSAGDILEILYDGKEFVADKPGVYKVTVKTDTEEVVVKIKVYKDSSSPYKNILQIKSNPETGLSFEKTSKNDISAFLESSKLKIKRANENDSAFVFVTKDMISDLHTDRLGRQLFEIKYEGLKYFAEAIIYNETFTSVEYIKANNFFFVTQEGNSDFLDTLTITEYHFDGSIQPNISVKNNNSDSDDTNNIEIKGYDKDKCIKQIVTLKYKGHETKILVNVLSNEEFDEYNNK